MLINGEDSGGLDLVEKARDAMVISDVYNLRKKDGVNDIGDKAATGDEGVEDVREVERDEMVVDGEVVREGSVGYGDAIMVVVKGGEDEKVAVEFRGEGGEHAAVARDGGGEDNENRRQMGKMIGKMESRFIGLGWGNWSLVYVATAGDPPLIGALGLCLEYKYILPCMPPHPKSIIKSRVSPCQHTLMANLTAVSVKDYISSNKKVGDLKSKKLE